MARLCLPLPHPNKARPCIHKIDLHPIILSISILFKVQSEEGDTHDQVFNGECLSTIYTICSVCHLL